MLRLLSHCCNCFQINSCSTLRGKKTPIAMIVFLPAGPFTTYNNMFTTSGAVATMDHACVKAVYRMAAVWIVDISTFPPINSCKLWDYLDYCAVFHVCISLRMQQCDSCLTRNRSNRADRRHSGAPVDEVVPHNVLPVVLSLLKMSSRGCGYIRTCVVQK